MNLNSFHKSLSHHQGSILYCIRMTLVIYSLQRNTNKYNMLYFQDPCECFYLFKVSTYWTFVFLRTCAVVWEYYPPFFRFHCVGLLNLKTTGHTVNSFHTDDYFSSKKLLQKQCVLWIIQSDPDCVKRCRHAVSATNSFQMYRCGDRNLKTWAHNNTTICKDSTGAKWENIFVLCPLGDPNSRLW